MERLADKTVEELKQIREDYIKKYIGDFDKPIDYARTLLHLDRLIMAKGYNDYSNNQPLKLPNE